MKTLVEKEQKRNWKIYLAAGLMALAACYLVLCALVDGNRILPGTKVNGIPMGGMTRKEAVEALEQEAQECREGAVFTVTAAGQDYAVDVGGALDFDYGAFAGKLLRPGKRAFAARGWFLLKSLLGVNSHALLPGLEDMEAVHQSVADSGLLDSATTTQTGCIWKDKQLIFTMGVSRDDTVDEEKLAEKIAEAAQRGDFQTAIDCPLMKGTVEPVDLDQVWQKVCTEPVNATLNPQNGYAVVDSAAGVSFDREAAQNALNQAKEGETVVVDLIYAEPEITTQDLTEHLFKDRLGTYTTQAAGVSNRTANIALAAQKCDGVILCSGDVFSFNNTVGEQTEATGFRTANAIWNGQIVQAYGGGICQVSSTIFAAALYANLEIVERWNHDYVCSYIPAGVDAAVAWAALDFRFANNTAYPVKIQVAYEDGNLTVDLWGTKTDDAAVELATETINEPSGGTLEIQTYRYVYSGEKSQPDIEKVAYSVYAT